MSYWDAGDFYGGGSKPKKVIKCWEKHPTYYIDGMPIVGGSCTAHYPDVDLFIGLDYNMKQGIRSYPWNAGIDIPFKIVDMCVPDSLEDFKKLVEHTADAMKAGKSVYVGCIGGHGRTGLFFAALTNHITGDKDSIVTVRNNYCKKAVENTQQVNWLNKHFGIKKAVPSKAGKVLQLKGKGTNPITDNLLQHNGVTDGKKTKYHCVKGNSAFVNTLDK